MSKRGNAKNRTNTEPSTAEEAIEAAIKATEQGERYQFGLKAQRHNENALQLYETASRLSPTSEESYDIAYNSAGIMYILATEFLPSPDCATMLLKSIQGYRTAGDQEDAVFNLASALTELAAMVQAVPSNLEAIPLLQEAMSILQTLESKQLSTLANLKNEDLPVEEMESYNWMYSAAIDTILARIETSTTLMDLSSTTAENIQEYSNLVEAALSVATELDNTSLSKTQEISSARLSSSVAVLEAEVEIGAQITEAKLQTVTELLQNITGESSIEQLSGAADHYSTLASALISSASKTNTSAPIIVQQYLETSLQYYQQGLSKLQNKFSLPKTMPAHHIPSLISSNLAHTATVHFILSLLTSSPAHLEAATKLALQSIDAAEASYVQTATSTPSVPALTKRGAADARTDFRSTEAQKEAAAVLWRIQSVSKASSNLGEKLLKALCSTEELERLEKEVQGDVISLLS